MKKVLQKKKTSETKKMISIEKKRVHIKEITSRKRKREKAKIIKKLEKISKLTRTYCQSATYRVRQIRFSEPFTVRE
jgi:uncharacterized protein YcbK (DUF882 family)